MLTSMMTMAVAVAGLSSGVLAQDYGGGYPPADYNGKDSCRYINFDEVRCKKQEVKKTNIVYVDDFFQKCETKTFSEKKSITVKIKRDVCKSTVKPIRVSTTIPITKQVCDDFPKDTYDQTDYKKTPDCKIVKSEKVVYTTDHVTKWVCEPDYKTETIDVPVKFTREICQEVSKNRKVVIPVWVKEKNCWVETSSKQVCGKTDVEHLYASSGKEYYEGETDYATQDNTYSTGSSYEADTQSYESDYKPAYEDSTDYRANDYGDYNGGGEYNGGGDYGGGRYGGGSYGGDYGGDYEEPSYKPNY